MSISYELYNAPADKAMMNEWDKDYSYPIERPDAVIRRLEALFPRIKNWQHQGWKEYDQAQEKTFVGSYSALAEDNCNPENEYIDVSLIEHRDGFIHWISITKGSPKLIREVLEEFDLEYVFEGQSCKLLDPYQYRDNWEPIEDAL